MTNPEYIPGVCNIGPAERARRRQSGIIGALVALALLAGLLIIHAPAPWRLLVFLPAAAAASGFLQDAFHFCAGFGLSGLYNVARSAGETDNVTSAEFRRKDKAKALNILGLSIVIGAAIAVLSLWL